MIGFQINAPSLYLFFSQGLYVSDVRHEAMQNEVLKNKRKKERTKVPTFKKKRKKERKQNDSPWFLVKFQSSSIDQRRKIIFKKTLQGAK